ncbi:cytochrome P450 90B2-like [Dioscorea cayenensis subsp. rotundata]|uniref:Cytochrome P450 90B2-like n=1 Tax=Dioscorea cayennensis subsp. rotundata TaxID=55577 RepID=A0AB40CZX6_DIOCR|nr:cytochrome P450 90B2-like [Dioscorea cayenensis subsp. rotundata]
MWILGEPEMEKLMREYNDFIKGVAVFPLNIPGTSYWKALKSREKILEIFKRKVEERKRINGDENLRMERDDLLNWLMKNTTNGFEEIGDTLLHTLFGGHDTTSRAICLLLYFLDGCPKAIQQLREEHLQVVKIKEDRGESNKLNWDDFKAMEFTKCVINETLRLGNIAGFLHKKARTEIEFKGYVIPQGCTVITHLSAVHLDPNLFENPNHFDPWRWMGLISDVYKMKNFMPFGGGPRQCPGAELARMEMMVFVHHLLLNYSWELAEPDHPITLPFIEFPKGLPVKIQPVPHK